MRLTAGSLVLSADDEPVGQLSGVTILPATNQLAEILVTGVDNPALVIAVPIQAVRRAAEDEIDLDKGPTTPRGRTGGRGKAARSAAPSAGTSRELARLRLMFGVAVHCSDGAVGPLQRLILDEYSQDVEAVVIGPSEWLAREVGVPVDWVREFHRDRVVLSCRREEVITMPPAPEDL